jgi:hypothetical protein
MDTLEAPPGVQVAPGGQEDIVADALDAAEHGLLGGVPFFAALVADQDYEAYELQAAWEHFAGCLRTFHALDTGGMHWSERFGAEELRLACDEEHPTEAAMQETAVQIALAAADEARHEFLNGARDGGQSL